MHLNVEYRNRITTVAQNYHLHAHDHYEIYSHVDGDGMYLCCINNTMYELEPGDVIIFRPGIFHSTYKNAAVRYERLYASFSRELESILVSIDPVVYHFLTQGAVLVHPEGDDAAAYSRLTDKLREDSGSCNSLKLAALLEQLVILSRAPIKMAPVVREGSSLIREIILYINNNYADITGISDIAAAFNYSKNHLSALFRREMGIGLNEFLREVRLSAAAAKLHSSISITDCAMGCGFSSPSYFISIFRKKYKITPKEFQDSIIVKN